MSAKAERCGKSGNRLICLQIKDVNKNILEDKQCVI